MLDLVVRRTLLSAVGDQAFPVAASRLWNTLPQNVTSAPSLSVCRKRVKTHLCNRSMPPSPLRVLLGVGRGQIRGVYEEVQDKMVL